MAQEPAKGGKQTPGGYTSGDEPDQAKSEPTYSFHAPNFQRKENRLGQVYTALARYLHKKRGADWSPKAAGASLRCDLLIGENQAGGIEWAKLGSYGVKPLVNFCRGFQALTRKTLMARSLRSYAVNVEQSEGSKENAQDNGTDTGSNELFGKGATQTLDEFLPLTFIFSGKLQERKEFQAEYARRKCEGVDNTWILKPSGGAHGDDIVVMRDDSEILAFLDQRASAAGWVVQKYLENPLLLPGGRKFDLRVMVLVAHDYTILMYSEGVLRTCSTAYSLDNLSDRFSHLANHCLQEQHAAYGSFDDAPDNLMSYAMFDKILRESTEAHAEGRPVTLDTHILPQIESQIVHSLMAVREQMEVPESANYRCFNLLGFDFMLDDKFHVYLVEVNSSPTTDPKLIPRLVEEVVRVAIDPLFHPCQVPMGRESQLAGTTAQGSFKVLWDPKCERQ